MGKILVLGNERTRDWSQTLKGSTYLPMPNFSLGEDGETKLSDFVTHNFVDEIDAIVFDIDHIQNNAICLSMALCVRLSVFELKKTALAHIMFMSSLNIEQFIGTPYASILFTKGISVDNPENVTTIIDSLLPLSPEEYHSGFTNLIKVNPNATEGRHSLANQWGADVLNRVVTGGITTNIAIQKARTSLYFKYVLLQTLSVKDLGDYILGKNARLLVMKKPAVSIEGKKILLLDDEADKGWGDILHSMFKGGSFKVICEQTTDFDNFSHATQNEIEHGDYDLILLDLRLDGLNEENIYKPEEFSGMKILKRIKQLNRGTQVIVFTASNKAWNLKALMEEGADGYYIKESPEYHLPIKYSEHNVEAFREEINRCLQRSYLRKVYKSIQDIKKKEWDTSAGFISAIFSQLDIAYNMLENAIEKIQYAYAYVCLEQVVEIVTKEFVEEVKENGYCYCLIKETKERCNNYEILENSCVENRECDESIDFPQWKRISSLYYQYWGGADENFGSDMQHLIEKRNAFIHNDKVKLGKTEYRSGRRVKIHGDIFNESAFLKLFRRIKEILSYI